MFFRVLTLIALVGLALTTWYLNFHGQRGPAQQGAAQRELPGYFLKGAVLTDYDVTGAPGLRLQAERIDQIDHSNDVELHAVRVDYDPVAASGPSGQHWVLLGDTARVRGAGQIVDVSGNVRLLGNGAGSASTAVVSSDAMSYDISKAVASTAGDVRIDFDGHVLTARGLAANLKERTLRLESKVNGRFHR